MPRFLILAFVMSVSHAWSGDFAVRRIESTLARNAQDQRFADLQIEFAQTLLRSEASMAPPAVGLPFTARRAFELRMPQEAGEPSALARHHRADLNRLESISRDLEAQRRTLTRLRPMRSQHGSRDD